MCVSVKYRESISVQDKMPEVSCVGDGRSKRLL